MPENGILEVPIKQNKWRLTMNRSQLPFFFSLFLSFLLSPSLASSNDTDQVYLADASDFFNAFKKDVGKAFNALKDTASDNAERRNENQTQGSAEVSNSPSVVQSSSSNNLTREENRAIQKLLSDAGYNPGPADGYPGNKTKSAIRDYQAAKGLPVDGLPSKTVLQNLRSEKSTVASNSSDPKNKTYSSFKPSIKKQADVTSVNQSGNYAPFGIPLGKSFSKSDYQSVSKQKLQSGEITGFSVYKVIPKKTHPAFKEYFVDVNYLGNVSHIRATNKWYKDGEVECPTAYTSIIGALENKYGKPKNIYTSGHGREAVGQVRISNNGLSIRLNYLCTHKRANLTFIHNQQSNLQAKNDNKLKARKEKENIEKQNKYNDAL